MLYLLHGKGDQYKLTKTYQDKLNGGLLDRDKLSDQEKEDVGIDEDESLGGGKTDTDYYYTDRESHPFPIDKSIRSTQKVDLRKTPRYGVD